LQLEERLWLQETEKWVVTNYLQLKAMNSSIYCSTEVKEDIVMYVTMYQIIITIGFN